MTGTFRAVQPRSLSSIEGASTQLRNILQIEPHVRVQMIQLIETVLPELLKDYLFQVLPDEEMPGIDGLTEIGRFGICLADHTYFDLYAGDPYARLVAAHELGHLIMHAHQTPSMARRSFADESVDPEWQADRFAEFWLAPRAGVLRCASAAEVEKRFTVPVEIAEQRFAEVHLANRSIQGELFE